MCLLHKQIQKNSLTMMQMPSHTNIPNTVRIMQKINKILTFVVSLQRFLVIITFLMFSRYERCFKSLPILLLDHNLCSRIHLFMALIKFLILMQNNAMLISHRQHLLHPCRDFLNLWLILFLIRITDNLRPDVVAKLIIKIFLIHLSIIKQLMYITMILDLSHINIVGLLLSFF